MECGNQKIKLFKRHRQNKEDEGIMIFVKEVYVYEEIHEGERERLNKTVWVKIKGRDVMVR